MRRATTAYLLTCAAIGVAGGFVLAGANWVSTLLFGVVPLVSVAIAGALRRAGVAQATRRPRAPQSG